MEVFGQNLINTDYVGVKMEKTKQYNLNSNLV